MANRSRATASSSRPPNNSSANNTAKPRGNFYPYWLKKKQNLPVHKATVILLPNPSENPTNSVINSLNRTTNNQSPSTSAIGNENINLPTSQYHSFILEKHIPNDPYPSWKLYFSTEKYSADSPIVTKIKLFESHFKDHPEEYNLLQIYSNFYFYINLNFILSDSKFTSTWKNFHSYLIEYPENTLSAAGLAMHTLCSKSQDIQNELNSNKKLIRKRTAFKIFRPRLENFEPIEDLSSIRSKKYDSLLSFRATVVKTGESEIISSWNTYECLICKSQQMVKQDDGIVIQPSSCKKTGCTNRSKFNFLSNSPYNRMEKLQIIRVQQLVTRGKQGDETKQIKQIEVELLNDLVDKVAPGEDVILTGILKVRPQNENFASRHDDGLKLYLQGISILKEKSYQNSNAFTDKDLQAVEMIQNEPSPFRLLVQSLCPSIFGHEMVKAGLVLALLGGSSNDYGLRPEIHVLMIGDPGVGKSEMLKACSQLSPKEVLVSGCGSSIAGLTVTVTNRKNGGELEGGALVLADGAHCCIDEFDKTRSNQQAVLEVMEQQTVGVAKAGVYCSIPARTSILAAANPDNGHYNRSKTVIDNLKMSTPLLSRFDLIFIMIDKADHNFDSMLIEHVQAHLAGRKSEPSESSFYSNNRNESRNSSMLNSQNDFLENRLRLNRGEEIDLLPRTLMQRYISYAKKNCNPRLTEEAGKALQEFYIELRQNSMDVNVIPITARQFEGLIRLTQARARADLSNEANLEHAMDVIQIFQYSMMDVFITDPDRIDVSQGNGRSNAGKSQASQVRQFLTLLQQSAKSLKQQIFDINELKEIAEMKGLEDNIMNIIDSLNNQGYLLKKSANVYKYIP